ncbi:MAG: hypothetical protein JNL74_17915 [Fibrobacteres bacterium]|nr:hypothetical protein [Fibrobacterota bacterium]
MRIKNMCMCFVLILTLCCCVFSYDYYFALANSSDEVVDPVGFQYQGESGFYTNLSDVIQTINLIKEYNQIDNFIIHVFGSKSTYHVSQPSVCYSANISLVGIHSNDPLAINNGRPKVVYNVGTNNNYDYMILASDAKVVAKGIDFYRGDLPTETNVGILNAAHCSEVSISECSFDNVSALYQADNSSELLNRVIKIYNCILKNDRLSWDIDISQDKRWC